MKTHRSLATPALSVAVVLLLAAAAFPSTSADVYTPPSSPAPAPARHAAARKTIEAAVEGKVYCQKCGKFGSWSLEDAEPIANAKISVICKSHREQVSYYKVYQTDQNGYFYAELKGFKISTHFLDHPLHSCRVKLVSSAREDCNLFSNINNALDGAKLRYEDKKVRWTTYEAVVYAAGPLAFRPNNCGGGGGSPAPAPTTTSYP